MRSKFKDEHPFGTYAQSLPRNPVLTTSYIEKRKQEAERIRQKYPDRIPVSPVILFFAMLRSLTEVAINPR